MKKTLAVVALFLASIAGATDFVRDTTALPGTKVDARPLSGPANQSVTATEFNTVTSAVSDLRDAIKEVQLDCRNYGCKGDGTTDDTVAIQATISAVTGGNGTPAQVGGIVYLPPGTYKITAPIVITAKSGIILKGAGKSATVLKASGAGMNGVDILKFVNSLNCTVQDMMIFGQATNTPHAAISFMTDSVAAATYGPSTKNTVRSVWIGYDSTAAVDYGIYVGGDVDGNNDFHSFYDVTITATNIASFKAVNTQAVDFTFVNCFFNFSQWGVWAPSFTWIGGAVGGNSEADFRPQSPVGPGTVRILGGNSEGSNRFIYTTFTPGVNMQVFVEGFRWSADADANADDKMVIFESQGGLTMIGNRFDTSDDRVSTIKLSAITDAFVDIHGNVWNQRGADAANVINWSELEGGEGYPGGVFRGAYENNTYVDTDDKNWGPKDGARAGEAFVLGGSADPTHGKWAVGNRYYFVTPTSGGYLGKVCTSAGIGASAWQATHGYTIGAHVNNDSGKVYEEITAATCTSAGSGGPTGTGSDITDGNCHWKYVGVKATFKGFGLIE